MAHRICSMSILINSDIENGWKFGSISGMTVSKGLLTHSSVKLMKDFLRRKTNHSELLEMTLRINSKWGNNYLQSVKKKKKMRASDIWTKTTPSFPSSLLSKVKIPLHTGARQNIRPILAPAPCLRAFFPRRSRTPGLLILPPVTYCWGLTPGDCWWEKGLLSTTQPPLMGWRFCFECRALKVLGS